MCSEILFYTMVFPDQPKTEFLTNTFVRLISTQDNSSNGVYWNWYNPMNKAAPGQGRVGNAYQSALPFWYSRALYKMYFDQLDAQLEGNRR